MSWAQFKRLDAVNNRGIAIPMVLVCVVLVTIMVIEFSFNQRLSRSLAYNDYETLRSEYLAKSALNISTLRIKIFKELGKNKSLPIPENMLNMIWNIPLIYPIDALLSLLGAGDEDDDDEEAKIPAEPAIEGSFQASISPVNGMNINFLLDDSYLLGVKSDKAAGDINKELREVNLDDFREKLRERFNSKLEEEEFGRKYGSEDFEELIGNVIDWIDTDSDPEVGGSEDAYYQSQKEPYKAKNGYLDTMDEAYLIKGMRDDFFDIVMNGYNIYAEDSFTLEDLVKNEGMMKYLSKNDLTDDSIEELQEDFSKEETIWDEKVEDFEAHIRSTYSVEFNETTGETPYVKLTIGKDINRYKIEAAGSFRRAQYKINVVIDMSDPSKVVFLDYKLY